MPRPVDPGRLDPAVARDKSPTLSPKAGGKDHSFGTLINFQSFEHRNTSFSRFGFPQEFP